MITVNIHEAKTNLSKLIQMAVDGHPFVIAKAGKPMVTVQAIVAPVAEPKRRIGSLEGMFTVPDDFDTRGQEEIERLFCDGPIFFPTDEATRGGKRA